VGRDGFLRRPAVEAREDSTTLVAGGLVLIPEGRRVFPGLSVTNNLRLGAWPKRKEQETGERNMEQVFEIFPGWRSAANSSGARCPAAKQQMLAIARGLMASPGCC